MRSLESSRSFDLRLSFSRSRSVIQSKHEIRRLLLSLLSKFSGILFFLSFLDVPYPPNGLTIVEKGSRFMVISWASPADSNAPITNYIVSYTEQWSERKGEKNRNFLFFHINIDLVLLKTGLARDVMMEGGKDRLRIENLTPATSYTFTVAAENRVGRAVPSSPITGATLEEAPKGHPRNVRVRFIDRFSSIKR